MQTIIVTSMLVVNGSRVNNARSVFAIMALKAMALIVSNTRTHVCL